MLASVVHSCNVVGLRTVGKPCQENGLLPVTLDTLAKLPAYCVGAGREIEIGYQPSTPLHHCISGISLSSCDQLKGTATNVSSRFSPTAILLGREVQEGNLSLSHLLSTDLVKGQRVFRASQRFDLPVKGVAP